MADSTNQSDQILSAASQSLQIQREGGTHRPADSIGRGSASAKRSTLMKRIKLMIGAVVAILAGSAIWGLVIQPLGVTGVMAVVMLSILALVIFSQFPKVKIPKRAELKQGNPKQMVARTELWLEAQRPALPPPAVQVVEQLGVQLDALGVQLETVDANHPAVREVRELVGEYIPETIDNYRKIPEHLRKEDHAGKNADDRLTDSLGKLSGEIDRVTRRMAEGALDDLAIKDRYLEYRYGGDELLEELQSSGKRSE
ncbi:MAG: hypothetical protein AAGK01_00615 [Pseudomonadota bacterium]